jgi:hypothetical protein
VHSQLKPGLPSLIEQDQQQLRLWSSADMEAALFADSEHKGIFTAERIFANDPDRYRMIVSLLSEGLSLRQIAVLTKTSINTVMSVRAREPAILEAEKQLVGRRMRGAVRLIVDKVLEQLESGALEITNVRDLQSILVGAGILTDKSELLLGGATARVERRDVDRVADLESLWEQLPSADVIDVTEAPPATGLQTETRPAKGGSAGPDGDLVEPAGEALDDTPADGLSDGSAP